MNNKKFYLTDTVKDILSAVELESVLWPSQDSDEFIELLKAKTDACAKYMMETMVECIVLYKDKNIDYGDAFGKTYAQFGPISSLVRMSDKINRLTALLRRKDVKIQVKEESVKDTLIDLCAYSLMTMYEMELLKKEKKR